MSDQMTLSEALKTRALVDKRITKSNAQIMELLCHSNAVKPPIKNQQLTVNKLKQSVSDLEKYWVDLNTAILRANLEKTVTVDFNGKPKTMSMFEALSLRGHGKHRRGMLKDRMQFLQQMKHHLTAHQAGIESQISRMVGEHKEQANLELVSYVSLDEIEKEMSSLIQLEHDLDVAIENINFTEHVDLGPPPKE